VVKVYMIGDKIPENINSVVDDWKDWAFILVANSPKKNKDADIISKRLNATRWDEHKVDDLVVKVGYLY